MSHPYSNTDDIHVHYICSPLVKFYPNVSLCIFGKGGDLLVGEVIGDDRASMLPSGAVFVSDGLHAVIKHNRSRYLMYFIIYSVD